MTIFARIRPESIYADQDPGHPFEVKFTHDLSDYLFVGNNNQYRFIDLQLLDENGRLYGNRERTHLSIENDVFKRVYALAKERSEPFANVIYDLLDESLKKQGF